MKKILIVLLILVGLAFAGLAVYYWMTPAGQLPHGLPGYEANSAHKHLKHGLAALVLALGSAVLAWFLSGKKSSNTAGASGSSESQNTP